METKAPKEKGKKVKKDKSEDTHKNSYGSMKTKAAGMLNITLLSTNAAQLKTAWLADSDTEGWDGIYYPLVTGLCISLGLQLVVGFLLISMSGSDMSHPGEKKAANRLNSWTTFFTVIISAINILLAAAVDHNQLRIVKNRVSECDQHQKEATVQFDAVYQDSTLEIKNIIIKGLKECGGSGCFLEGFPDPYVLMRIKVKGEDDKKMDSQQGKREKTQGEEGSVALRLVKPFIFKEPVSSVLRVAVVNYNRWKQDKMIGKIEIPLDLAEEFDEKSFEGSFCQNSQNHVVAE